MKITVISGFLGAGKTTLIRRIISNADSSLAVIVNEFGDVGIDRELISSSGKLEVAELASGCVCCTLRADLRETLTELKEMFSPERVLLEPSGVSMASSIVEALQEPHLEGIAELEGVISVIDASAFSELYPLESFQRLYRDAIANASAVVINKVDIASAEDVCRVERIVSEINPSALLLRSSFDKVVLPERLPGVELRMSDGIHLLFDSFSATPKEMSTRRAEVLFDRLKQGEFGKVIRAKGIFRARGKSWYYDLSSGRISREELAPEAEPSFVVIGSGLRKEALRKVLEA